jgi:hypothetical protein
MIVYDFCLLPAQFCYITVYIWKHCANRRPVCTLENFQWCREPCFAGAALLSGRCLPLAHCSKPSRLNIWYRSHRKHCSSVAVQLMLIKNLLPSKGVVSLFALRSLPSNGSTYYSMNNLFLSPKLFNRLIKKVINCSKKVRINRKEIHRTARCQLFVGVSFDLTFNSEHGGSKFLRNVGELLLHYTVLHPRRECP